MQLTKGYILIVFSDGTKFEGETCGVFPPLETWLNFTSKQRYLWLGNKCTNDCATCVKSKAHFKKLGFIR